MAVRFSKSGNFQLSFHAPAIGEDNRLPSCHLSHSPLSGVLSRPSRGAEKNTYRHSRNEFAHSRDHMSGISMFTELTWGIDLIL